MSLLTDTQSDAIVATILSLGRALQLPITAEGIEDLRTKHRLCDLGCSDGQGWLFGKAVSAEDVRKRLGVPSDGDSHVAVAEHVVKETERRDRFRRPAAERLKLKRA